MRLWVALGMALVWSGTQAQMKIPAVKLAKPPVIDGVLSEGEWDGATHLTGFIDPNNGKPVADQTEVWLAYDSEAIFVAFRMADSEPGRIKATSTQPGSLGAEDTAELWIDPFNKKEWGNTSSFQCNCKGVQGEYLAGGRSAKKEWRGAWQSKAKVSEQGWTAEMRIPWNLMFLPSKGKHDVLVMFRRYQLHSNIQSILPDVGQQWRFDRAGTWTDVDIPASKTKPASFQAYLSPQLINGRFDATAGLDIRYRLSPQFTALASFNPDFANTEQSVASIEFSRAERYLDDSRPFFNEGNSFIDVTDSYGSAFYSRRIADFDFGAKAFGNVGSRHEIGAFATQSGDSETNGMFRYAYKFTPRSSVTLYGTSHQSDAYENQLVGTRLVYGKGDWSGTASTALNDDDGISKSAGSAVVNYAKNKWTGTAAYSWVEPGFNPAIGYASYENVRGANVYAEYTDIRNAGYIKMYDHWITAKSMEHYDGSNQSQQVQPVISFQTKNNAYLRLACSYEQFDNDYEHTGSCSMSFFNTPYTKQLTLGTTLGTRAGHDTTYTSINVRDRIWNCVDLSLLYARQEYLGITEQTVFTIGWIIDPKRTLTGRTVYSQGKTNAYLTFKSAGFTGMDWYLIVGDPNALEWKDRIVAKFVWAW